MILVHFFISKASQQIILKMFCTFQNETAYILIMDCDNVKDFSSTKNERNSVINTVLFEMTQTSLIFQVINGK